MDLHQGMHELVMNAVRGGMSHGVAALIRLEAHNLRYELAHLKADLRDPYIRLVLRGVGELLVAVGAKLLDRWAVCTQLMIILEDYATESRRLRNTISPLATSLILKLVSAADLAILLRAEVPPVE